MKDDLCLIQYVKKSKQFNKSLSTEEIFDQCLKNLEKNGKLIADASRTMISVKVQEESEASYTESSEEQPVKETKEPENSDYSETTDDSDTHPKYRSDKYYADKLAKQAEKPIEPPGLKVQEPVVEPTKAEKVEEKKVEIHESHKHKHHHSK